MPRPQTQDFSVGRRPASQQADKTLEALFRVSENDQATAGTEADVLLSDSELRVKYLTSGRSVTYLAYDLIGASVSMLPDNEGCVVRAFAYPLLATGVCGRGKCRQRRCLSLCLMNGKSALLKDIMVAHRWYMAIVRVARGLSPCADELSTVGAPLRRRRFLIFVNPFSGRRHAKRTFQRTVAPMLCDADVDATMVTSEYQGHVRDYVKDANLRGIDCILLVSGDGLVFEALNGLMQRDDSQTAIRTPLSIVPAGSGNGLAATLLNASSEPYSVESAMMGCLKGHATAMDVLRLSTAKSTFFSFLSVSWGIVSDVDLESEVLRCLGSLRFIIYAVLRMLFLRRYCGRFAYLPHDAKLDRGHGQLPQQNGRTDYSQGKRKVQHFPAACDGLLLRQSTPSSSDVSWLPGQQSEASVPCDIKDKLSDKWVTMDGKFVVVVPVMISHVARDVSVFSEARLDDGLLHILLATGDITRWTLFKMFFLGKYSFDKNLRYIKARAFRLEPREDCGTLAVDGEAWDVCSMHGVVEQSKARVMIPHLFRSS